MDKYLNIEDSNISRHNCGNWIYTGKSCGVCKDRGKDSE